MTIVKMNTAPEESEPKTIYTVVNFTPEQAESIPVELYHDELFPKDDVVVWGIAQRVDPNTAEVLGVMGDGRKCFLATIEELGDRGYRLPRLVLARAHVVPKEEPIAHKGAPLLGPWIAASANQCQVIIMSRTEAMRLVTYMQQFAITARARELLLGIWMRLRVHDKRRVTLREHVTIRSIQNSVAVRDQIPLGDPVPRGKRKKVVQ